MKRMREEPGDHWGELHADDTASAEALSRNEVDLFKVKQEVQRSGAQQVRSWQPSE